MTDQRVCYMACLPIVDIHAGSYLHFTAYQDANAAIASIDPRSGECAVYRITLEEVARVESRIVVHQRSGSVP